jgi:hypothetical protein
LLLILTYRDDCKMYITATLEMELEQALLEKSDVHETLMKLDNINKSHVQDKLRQQDDIKKVKFPPVMPKTCLLIYIYAAVRGKQ